MSVEATQETIRKLRAVELRQAVHGVDAAQVRNLLDLAADTLADAEREQTELRNEVERLRAANDESAIGKALLAATRAGEALIAEARERAASLSSEAEAEASALLEQIRSQAGKSEQETKAAREQLEREITAAKKAQAKELESARAGVDIALADARHELLQLETKTGQLRSLITELERRIADTARQALQELEALSTSAPNRANTDILVDLRPAAESSDVRPTR
jgi:cell division septum initiation protein DivIVA